MIILLLAFDTEEEKEKFSVIFQNHAEFMIKVAHGILHSIPDAEDVVQEVFLYIADNLEKINISDRQKTESYLALLTKHKAIDYIRRHKKEVPTDGPEDFEASLMANIAWEEGKYLSEALLALPDEHRTILELYYYHGYSYREIAELLDQTTFAVAGKARRAKQKLAQMLTETE